MYLIPRVSTWLWVLLPPKNQLRGRPFPKGVSGNPSGRPKRTEEEICLVEACRQKTAEALVTIEDIMLNSRSERNRLAAAQYIIDRGWGRAPERIELAVDSGPVEVPVLGRDLSPEEVLPTPGLFEASPSSSKRQNRKCWSTRTPRELNSEL